MPNLFLIGAGFSKAVSANMPLMSELLDEAVDWDHLELPGLPSQNLPGNHHFRRLSKDVEALLTYLYQEMPWLSNEEALMSKAVFFHITRRIAEKLRDRENLAMQGTLPIWTRKFVEHLHEHRATVATFNYDTLLERLTHQIPADRVKARRQAVPDRNIDKPDIFLADLYNLPLAPLASRSGWSLGQKQQITYRLLKIHGSINWFYSGQEDATGQQVYFKNVPELAAQFDAPSVPQLENINVKDLSPLIIPPVAEKSSFYRTPLVRTMWSELSAAVKAADKIYCIGYSLPKTDLVTRLFLQSVAGGTGKTIYIVNQTNHNVEVVQNYSDVFEGCTINNDYLGTDNMVEKMVDEL